MIKRHFKRLAKPKSWNILKKQGKFIIRPKPGAHSFENGLAITLVLRDLLKYAQTTKEAKKILINKIVMIDGTEYMSLSEASRTLGVHLTTIRSRILSNNELYKYYYYKETKNEL